LNYASFALGIKLANLLPLPLARKVANHSSQNKTHLPEINKPQARISGMEIFMCYPIDSNTCIEVITRGPDRFLPDSLKLTWFWDLTLHRFVWKAVHGAHGRWNQSGFSFS
jgi:hypothetical protein